MSFKMSAIAQVLLLASSALATGTPQTRGDQDSKEKEKAEKKKGKKKAGTEKPGDDGRTSGIVREESGAADSSGSDSRRTAKEKKE